MLEEFPIKTATSCQLKWTWSTIFLNSATTASCHRVEHLKLTPENFLNFHNLPKKLEDRQAMLNGQRPIGECKYCYKIEDAGGISDRIHHQNFKNLTPHELETDAKATVVTPRILEVYFNNTCNLSCLYCGPWYSSVWENEYKKYGNIKQGELDLTKTYQWKNNENYNLMLEKLWEWMKLNSKHLRKFHILGGEPFYQKEFIDCLDHFENYPNRDCEIVIVTNLMVNDQKMDYFISRFKDLVGKKKIKAIQITASLDCWGPQAEYIRSGLDLNQWQRNFEKLLDYKWIRLQINHAINILSIKYMVDLIKQINLWNKKRKIYLSYMTVVYPTYLNPDIFGAEFFKEDLESFLSLLPKDSEFDHSTYEYCYGMAKQIMSSNPNVVEIKKLKLFLNEIDKRRKTDYKTLFPWLEKEFQQYCN